MKKITIDAGAEALIPEKDIADIKKNLYQILFTLKRMPEYNIKWALKREIEPVIRGLLHKFVEE